jgi:PAS domain S-box-containing protein
MDLHPNFPSFAFILGAGVILACLLLLRAWWAKSELASRSSVFNAMKDGVIVLDKSDRIVDQNPVAKSLFQDKPKLTGRDIASLIPKWAEWRAANPTGEIEGEFSTNPAGERLTLSVRTSPLFDPRGRLNGRLVLITDITNQKRVNEQLAEISRVKSQLLASLGHDLRSPLGAIIGYAEMLSDGSFGPMTEAQANASSEILDGANQLLAFMNNIVGQVQIESGKILLQEHPFYVEEVIGPLLSTLNFHAKKKGLTLTQAFDPALPSQLLGDQFWLRQIVLNLVHNSVKFTTSGFVHVSFIKQNSETWMIQVMDTGIGIPADAQKRVFDAFEQVDRVDTSTQGGFGLGLSIVAKLTSIMHGTIDLKSEDGKGTTFSVILPLKVPVPRVVERVE